MTEGSQLGTAGALAAEGGPKATERAWIRLRMMLERAAPGQMIYLEVGPPRERPALVKRMRLEVGRTFLYVNLGNKGAAEDPEWPALPVLVVLHQALERYGPADVCVIDGFEDRATTREQSFALMDELNLAREALGAMPAALVFLLPPYLVYRIHQRALNLWSWRMHHVVLYTPRVEQVVIIESTESDPETSALAEQLGRRFELARKQGLSFRDLLHGAALPYVETLYRAAAYQRALEVLEELSGNPELSALPLEQAWVEYWSGLCWGFLGMFDRARAHLEEALALLRVDHGADEGLTIKALGQLGQMARRDGAYEQAESYLLEALQMLETEHQGRFDGIVAIRLHLLLADVYVAMGRLYEAYALTEATRDQYESLRLGHKREHVLLLDKLSALYGAFGDHHQALSLCHRLLDMDASALGDDARLLALWQRNLARIYDALGDDAQAQRWLQQALATQDRAQGQEKP